MRNKSFDEALKAAKADYFAAADKVLESPKGANAAPEALRQLLKKQKKPAELSRSPKAAS